MNWHDREAVLERYAGDLTVVRDDLLDEGGSKLRFLPFLTEGAEEVVFGGPFAAALRSRSRCLAHTAASE